MDNIFGTDGIRDRAGEGLLAASALDCLAVAVARFIGRRQEHPRVLFGRDTRISGPEIEDRFGRALAREGCRVESLGIAPTPAVSLLVAEEGYDLGVVVSASHNPPRFNGIKLFDRWGRKLEQKAEQRITRDFREAEPSTGRARAPQPREELLERYVEVLLGAFDTGFLAGRRVVLDCAGGATAIAAPEVFRRAGAELRVLNDELDGRRINQDCGSLHPAQLQRAVREWGADFGFAFDGDGDRVITVDDAGAVVDGDDMLALWALYLHEHERLSGDRVVATVMSNAGMERFLKTRGIEVVRTPVGDREVFLAMSRLGCVLGGEQSGHLIYVHESATGDGIRTALHMGRVVTDRAQSLATLRAPIPRFPQVLLAIDVPEKIPFAELPSVLAVRDEAASALESHGRVFLRYSGTEPVARVLVEGEDPEENERWATRIADQLRTEMNIIDR